MASVRVYLGLSQAQVAERVGVTVRTVSRWESGVSKPSALALRALKEAGLVE